MYNGVAEISGFFDLNRYVFRDALTSAVEKVNDVGVTYYDGESGFLQRRKLRYRHS